MINYKLSLQSLSSSWMTCGWVESPNVLTMAWSFGGLAPIMKLSRSPPTITSLDKKTLLSPRRFQGIKKPFVRSQGHRPNIKREGASTIFITQEIRRILGALCRNWSRYLFLCLPIYLSLLFPIYIHMCVYVCMYFHTRNVEKYFKEQGQSPEAMPEFSFFFFPLEIHKIKFLYIIAFCK